MVARNRALFCLCRWRLLKVGKDEEGDGEKNDGSYSQTGEDVDHHVLRLLV